MRRNSSKNFGQPRVSSHIMNHIDEDMSSQEPVDSSINAPKAPSGIMPHINNNVETDDLYQSSLMVSIDDDSTLIPPGCISPNMTTGDDRINVQHLAK